MTQRGRKTAATLRMLSARPWRRLGFLLVLATAPVAVYAGVVPQLILFVNGTVADANQMNANFADVKAAVDDNDARVFVLEALPDQQCLAGEYAAGIDASGNLICDTAPPSSSLTIVSTPIPSPWPSGTLITSPPCPAGSTVVGGGIGFVAGSGSCTALDNSFEGASVITELSVSSAANSVSCSALIFDLQFGPVSIFTDCTCFAVCEPTL